MPGWIALVRVHQRQAATGLWESPPGLDVEAKHSGHAIVAVPVVSWEIEGLDHKTAGSTSFSEPSSSYHRARLS